MSKFLQNNESESEGEGENQFNQQNCFKSKFLQELDLESDDENQTNNYYDFKQQNCITTTFKSDNQNRSEDEVQNHQQIIDNINNQSKAINISDTQQINQANENLEKIKKKRKKKQTKNQQIQQESIKDGANKIKKIKLAAQLALEMQEQKRIIQQEQNKLNLIQQEEEEQLQKEEQMRIEKQNQERQAMICFHCSSKGRNLKQKQKQLQDDIQKYELIKEHLKLNQQQQQQQQQQKEFYICSILGDFDSGKTTILRGLIDFMKRMGFQVELFGYSYVCQPTQNNKNLFAQMQSYFPVSYENQKFIFYDRPQQLLKNFQTFPNCDIAIVIINLMQGQESKSIKDIEYLKLHKIPFIIALNQCDRCFEKSNSHQLSYQQLQEQMKSSKCIYNNRLKSLLNQLAQLNLSAVQYWEQVEAKTNIPLVPTSGTLGMGYEDLLATLVKHLPVKSISNNQPKYLILNNKDNKENQSLIDCLVIDGHLKRGDYLLIAVDGYPTSVQVQNLQEIHEENNKRYFDKNWVSVEEVKTDQAFVRVITDKLQQDFLGCQFKIANSDEEVQEAQEFIKSQFINSLSKFELDKEGIGVFAQDEASLLKLFQFLQQNYIQICFYNIGIVSKDLLSKFIYKYQQQRVDQKFACILAYGIYVQQDIIEIANQHQIQIISDDNCLSLISNYQKYVKNVIEDKKNQLKDTTIFPCLINVTEIIQISDPMTLKIQVAQGILATGTPLCQFSRKQPNLKQIGVVKRIEQNQQALTQVRVQTGSVTITVENNVDMHQFQWQFLSMLQLASIISRKDIDIIKEYYREDLTMQDWQMVRELKSYFSII